MPSPLETASCRARIVHRRADRGFTLVEIMVTVAIVAVVVGIAVPALGNFLQNRQVNSLAESLASGLRLAQSEAVQRNRNVDMVLSTSDLTNPSNPSTVTLAAGGLALSDSSPNWMVRVSADSTSGGRIQSMMAADGFPNARFSGPAGITFSQFGRLSASIAASGTTSTPPAYVVFRIANPFVTIRRCVYVSSGGSVRVCDPNATSGNPRSCVPPLAATDCPAS